MSHHHLAEPWPHNHWPYYPSPHTAWPTVDHTISPPPSYYPESSQRTILTSSPDNIDHWRSQSSDYARSTVWDPNPPTVDEFQCPVLEILHPEQALVDDPSHSAESRQTSPLPSISVAPSVKVEPEDSDGCFIMELSFMSPGFGLSVSGTNQPLAPPTEVPLRATQASREMRKMMSAFRMNPFAMHSGKGRGVMPAPWSGGGPLEEEPLIFEFQLDIGDNSADRQFDHTEIPSGSPTDSLETEEEAHLRSFSPSFELHPEDTRSEMGEEHEQEQEDYTDQDQQNEWSDADYCNQSEVDTSSTTHSIHTPSESRSAHTPFNESSAYQYPTPPPPAASTWEIDYQPHDEEHLPPAEKLEGGHKIHRLHTTTSHPYLRRSLLNHHQVSPSSSTHSLPRSHAHLHTHPQLNYGYSVPQQSTHHHHHQHYSQVPSQSYSTFHESMIPAPLSNLGPITDSIVSSPYTRPGRILKLAEDQTSTSHHHPAGIVNEYAARGSTSGVYASQHDTHAGGHPYETIQHSSSTLGHAFSPSRRWSLPETVGGTM